MNKMIKALLEELQKAIASRVFESEEKKADAEKAQAALQTKFDENQDDVKALKEVVAGIEELRGTLPSTETVRVKPEHDGETEQLLDVAMALQNACELYESHAGVRETLDRLLMARWDIDHAVLYLKEIVLLSEMMETQKEMTENLDAIDDAEAAKNGATPTKHVSKDVALPSEAFLIVPDPKKPSTWAVQIWEDLEQKVTSTQLGRASALLSPLGATLRVDVSEDQLAEAKTKLVSLYREAGFENEDIPLHLVEVDAQEETEGGDEPPDESKSSEEIKMKKQLSWDTILKIQEVLAKVETDEVKELGKEFAELFALEEHDEDQAKKYDEVVATLEKTEIPEADESEDEESEDEDDGTEEETEESEASEDIDLGSELNFEDMTKEQMAKVLKAVVADNQLHKKTELARLRMKQLKDEGLADAFATDDDRKAEIEWLMSADEEAFSHHRKTLQLAKAAFTTTTAVASEEDGDDEAIIEPPVSVLAVASEDVAEKRKKAVEQMSVLWEIE